MQLACGLGPKFQKNICVNVCTDITPLPPVFILSLNVIIEYPHSIFSKDTQPFNFIKCNIIWKLVYKVKCISQINGGLIVLFENSRIRFFLKISWLNWYQYLNLTNLLIIPMIIIFLSCHEKAHSNRKFSSENSKPHQES